MEKKNSLLMLKYMISEGFNPNNYKRILELLQSAPLSLSKSLVGYNPYLLSNKVVYSQLDEYGIDGAFGYLENKEIVIPKTIGNDKRFLCTPSKSLYRKHSYGAPSIDEFSAVMFLATLLENNNDRIYKAIQNSLGVNDQYFGFIVEKYPSIPDVDQSLIHVYYQLISKLGNYEFTHDTVSEENKEFYLKKKK